MVLSVNAWIACPFGGKGSIGRSIKKYSIA